MTEKLSRNVQEEYATKLTLIGIFLSIFAAFVSRMPGRTRREGEVQLRPFDLVLLSLATFRLGRLIAYDQVTEPLRRPFTKTVEDNTGAGKTVEPRQESGIQKSLGQLVSCPICSGTWVAAGLVYGLHILTGPTRVFMAIMSAAGGAEIVDALMEALGWSGQLARRRAGEKE